MIERVIEDVVSRYPLSRGDNLAGMCVDVRHFLGWEGHGWEYVSLEVTEAPERLIVAELRSRARAQDVARSLEEVWKACQYRYFQSSSIVMTPEVVTLTFVTIISEDGFCVTGELHVALLDA